MHKSTNDIEWNKIQNYKKESFICEICKCETPKLYEGSEPNTCAMCMPLEEQGESGYGL